MEVILTRLNDSIRTIHSLFSYRERERTCAESEPTNLRYLLTTGANSTDNK